MMGQTKRPKLVSHGSRVEERHNGEASAERGDVEPARCKTAPRDSGFLGPAAAI